MIRAITKGNGRPALYGLTIRGIAVLGAALGVLLAAVVLSVIALGNSSRATGEIRSSRSRSILISCEEQNTRHDNAKAGLEALVAATPQKSSLPKKVQEEQLEQFVDAIAPAYVAGDGSQLHREYLGCLRRVAEFSRP